MTRNPVEFLEGTTYAGKTTVGALKFMLMVAESHQKQHIIAGLDLGTIEKNIINKDLGVVEMFGSLIDYYPSGHGTDRLPHISYQTDNGTKIIYILGYGDKVRWKKALGSQSGCILIDEINIADMEFVREAAVRCDYLMATLNPDDPNLPVYKEYINKSRPLKKYIKDLPIPIYEDLAKSKPSNQWIHWFFSFKDNIGATPEKIKQIISMSAPGTKLYKNKILGLRGRHTGLIFDLKDEQLKSESWLLQEIKEKRLKFAILFASVDTSYSRKSDDTIAFFFQGITVDGRLIKIAVETYNNTSIVASNQTPIAPSDLSPLLHTFLDKWVRKYGMIDCCYIDSADAATNTEVEKYKREKGSLYNFAPSWKKLPIIDRLMLERGWSAQGLVYIIVEYCKAHIDEQNVYSWLENKQLPEDANDHTVNASQYGWMPYKHMIGTERN